ncbi:MAG: type II toxin-antitoxin system prevent-host-death family antitoxin [Acidobacteria bacterium]|nr:type II toxin-antitoxin system prevent-host-death family antitoxin [Acidobacteriota bacterium]
MDTYSTYEAKARFSEILRKVRAGRRVIVTHHGTQVAEIRPVETAPASLAARLAELERSGIVQRAARQGECPAAVARKRGALSRFVASRD